MSITFLVHSFDRKRIPILEKSFSIDVSKSPRTAKFIKSSDLTYIKFISFVTNEGHQKEPITREILNELAPFHVPLMNKKCILSMSLE